MSYSAAANNSVYPRTGTITIAGQDFTLTQAGAAPVFSLTPASASFAAAVPGTGLVTVTAAPPDAQWAAASNVSWITIVSYNNGIGSGQVGYVVDINVSPTTRNGTLTVAGQTFTVMQAAGTAGLLFTPIEPCRMMDTRDAAGTFGGPMIPAGGVRFVPVVESLCNIPASAQAYSLNVTVVPAAGLDYLSVWPAGETQPRVSTLNSLNGRVVANAAIVPAGTLDAFNVFASDATNVIVDINGYFAPAPGGIYFYPVAPCRVVDTRGANGAFGGPYLAANSTRNFAISSGPCGVSGTPLAYSLNLTAVPRGPLNYLTTWAAGQAQPLTSTLNSMDGGVVANAAIVPAGLTSSEPGAISVFTTNDTDLVIDINGFFGPPAAGALALYTLTPCRVADTRNNAGPFGGPILAAGQTRTFAIPASACNIPTSAEAYAFNVTAVPPGPLGYLTVWPAGVAQPVVSTLNANAGEVVANAAIVPAGAAGAIQIFVTDATHLVLDINAYFGQ